jgi:hypothetical protein
MDSIDLVSEAHEGQLFNDVVAIMRGRVIELACSEFPGASEGDVTVIKFNPGSTVEHVRGEDVEEEQTKELSDVPSVNDAAPYYEMHYHFSREQLYNISAKGGFVPGYADYAVPSNILKRPWQSIPVKIDVSEMRIGHLCPKCGHPVSADEASCSKCGTPSRASSLFFFELEDANCAHVDARIGYVLDEFFVTSPEMSAHPERVVGIEHTMEQDSPDMISRDQVITEAMLDFDDEFEDLLSVENAIEAPDIPEEQEKKADEMGDPREHYYVDSRVKQEELDAAAIEAILSGGSAIEAVEAAIESSEKSSDKQAAAGAESQASAAESQVENQAEQAGPASTETQDQVQATSGNMVAMPDQPEESLPVTTPASGDEFVFSGDADLNNDGVVSATERKIIEKRRMHQEQEHAPSASDVSVPMPQQAASAQSSKSADADLFDF